MASSSATDSSLYKLWIGGCIAYPAVTLLSIAATNLWLGLVVVGWFIFRRTIPTRSARPLLVLISLYLGWTLIAVALSPYTQNWTDWLEERSTFLALLPGLVVGADAMRSRKAFRVVEILLLLLAIYATYQFFYGWDLARGMKPLQVLFHRYHATGLQNFHLTFAGMIALTLPVVLGLLSGKGLRSILVALAGTICVTAAMARSIMLGLAGGGVLLAVFGSRRLRVAGLTVMLALIILPLTIFSASGERLARGLGVSKAEVEQGDPTRIYLWKSALNILQRYPALGIGYGNWHAAFDQYQVPYEHYSTTARAHNDFLDALVESGILGGCLLLSLWIYIIFRLVQAARRTTGAQRDLLLGFLVAFLVLLFGGLFQGYQTDAENALLLWFMVGVGVQISGRSDSPNPTLML